MTQTQGWGSGGGCPLLQESLTPLLQNQIPVPKLIRKKGHVQPVVTVPSPGDAELAE